jgi:hypothetical protein
MHAPRRGNGADFDWSRPYRMYHGDQVPGFPQHPHRGFETLTLVQEGTCDHTDSLGAAGRYGGDGRAGGACARPRSTASQVVACGPCRVHAQPLTPPILPHADLQWMTAGAGCVHGENFPLRHVDKTNTLRLFQIWLNLPAANKFALPTYVMNWAESMPFLSGVNGAECEVAAGTLGGVAAGPPPPHSWAADAANDVGVFLVSLPPASSFTLPPAARGGAVNRVAYVVEGPTGAEEAQRVRVGGKAVPQGRAALHLRADAECIMENGNAAGDAVQVLILQGRPIGEPVAQRGPFVMNTQAELAQAFADYRATQFGGWPWAEDAVVFPREQGRFADVIVDGKKVRTLPPPAPKLEL